MGDLDQRRAIAICAYQFLVVKTGFQPTATEIAARSGIPFRELYQLFPGLTGLRDPKVPKRSRH